MTYVIVWEFEVRAEAEAEFERRYGLGGDWVALFRRESSYISTELLRDTAAPRRYLTIDRWESRAAYRAFRQARAEAYQHLDVCCEQLTTSERLIGAFDG